MHDAGVKKGRTGLIDRLSLEGKLLFATAIVGFLMLVLTAGALVPTCESYYAARDNLRAVERFRLVLEAANRMSAERGPANDIMSIEPGSSLAAEERLKVFRQASDLALAALKAPMDRQIAPAAAATLTDALSKTEEQLRHARQIVDHIAAMPLSARRPADVQNAIGEMIGVVDIFQDVVDWHVAAFTIHRPELTAPLLTGRMISDLREYGGRIASQIMGPVTTRQPLQVSHLVESGRTMGKILELRLLLQGQRIGNSDDPLASRLMKEVDTVFYGTGLELVNTMIAEGRKSGSYSMSAVELTRRYVPTLQPLEKLRTLFLDEIVETYRLQREAASYRLAEIGTITLLALAVLLLLFRSIRLHLLNPLLMARRQIIALAEGARMAGPGAISNAPEMRSLFDALELLRTKLEERSEYEARLKVQAERDGLTGVWNRRALESFGLSPGSDDICLMLIDIDHFKAVNDTHGHLAGDAVLIEIAGLLKASLQTSDIVARFGGEEFAIVSRSDLAASVDFAEKLRGLIQTHVIRQADTQAEITVTASIGVAAGRRGPDMWRQLIAAADEALYSAKKDDRNRTCVFEAAVDQPPSTKTVLFPPGRTKKSA
ncbi:GGDEF domain-containing protein [Rhizobium binxianense]